MAWAAIPVVQGFWKAHRDKQYMQQLRTQSAPSPESFQEISQQYAEARVHGWRAMHVILSIMVTTLAVLHGIFLLPRLTSPTPGVLFGVAGLVFLSVLGLSGLAAETKRKTATFGTLKKAHLWLMVSALTLIELHAVAAGSTFGSLGTTVSLGILVGTIGMIGVGVEYAAIKGAKRFFNLTSPMPQNGPCVSCPANLARRATLQKLGTLAVGTLVAISFAEAAALMPKILPTLETQRATQQLITQPPDREPSCGPPCGKGAGVKLGNLANIPANSAYYFQYPQGISNILIRLRDGSLVAYSSTCTHRPCTVGYDSGTDLIRCPCHGAVFDPARGATVLQGPAPSPLPTVPLSVDTNGDVWLA